MSEYLAKHEALRERDEAREQVTALEAEVADLRSRLEAAERRIEEEDERAVQWMDTADERLRALAGERAAHEETRRQRDEAMKRERQASEMCDYNESALGRERASHEETRRERDALERITGLERDLAEAHVRASDLRRNWQKACSRADRAIQETRDTITAAREAQRVAEWRVERLRDALSGLLRAADCAWEESDAQQTYGGHDWPEACAEARRVLADTPEPPKGDGEVDLRAEVERLRKLLAETYEYLPKGGLRLDVVDAMAGAGPRSVTPEPPADTRPPEVDGDVPPGYRVYPWMGRWSWRNGEMVSDGCVSRDEAVAAARWHAAAAQPPGEPRPTTATLGWRWQCGTCDAIVLVDKEPSRQASNGMQCPCCPNDEGYEIAWEHAEWTLETRGLGEPDTQPEGTQEEER